MIGKNNVRKPKEMNALNLAYIGDAVYEMYIRHFLVLQGGKPNVLHKKAIQFVSAKAQAQILHYLLPNLTEEEKEIVKRGRNTKSNTSPKNADIVDYRHSTAFEALIGYLYLSDNKERMDSLIQEAIAFIEREYDNEQNKTK
ncbi:ribonuclease-3 family protein [Tepidibacillus fermentans]|uniref:Mini-ribonuclease 3 n=2 Tax=Tepidibacillus fermentans TaxID=1281767 RepID=A0A4R3KED7_9BACI|nr:ribonuclease-3 family protein [Tepidibacillus fermentans]